VLSVSKFIESLKRPKGSCALSLSSCLVIIISIEEWFIYLEVLKRMEKNNSSRKLLKSLYDSNKHVVKDLRDGRSFIVTPARA